MAIIVFEHSELAGSDRLGEALRGYGHQLDVRRLHEGDAVPADLGEVDGIVACGGAPDPHDDSISWMDDELALLAEASQRDLPVVGLCLGSQLLARALGGTIGPLEGPGIEIGWHPVDLTPAGREDPLHAGIAWRSMQPHWHRFQVTELPDGARHLASSPSCRHQAWARGLRTYGFQYHPEIHPDALDLWAADEPEALTEAGITLERMRADTQQHYPACARLADRLFEAIALVLMPVDRRYQGVVKDLHH